MVLFFVLLDVLLNVRKMISKGRNVSEFFAQVVKNVASNNLEIRKLVYIYLLSHAEQEPDLALLSINTFQKHLTDPNPLIRAMAPRVLSGAKVPMIGYVRKVAALAIPKCFRCDFRVSSPLLSTLQPRPTPSTRVGFNNYNITP